MPASRESAVRFIIALGIISLFADVTYEGARSVNGPFLGILGAGPAIIGFVAGAGELAGYVLRLGAGVAADRTRAYWPLTIFGYIVNLAAVPLMALSNHWELAAALIVLERAGKGVRTPPRNVMLAQASGIVGRGWGFGLHEFMDQTGAFIGPLIVALVLHQTHQYSRAYAVLAIPAGLAVASMFTALKFYPNPSRFEEAPEHPTPAGQRLPRAFWIYVAAGGLLAAGFVDFSLMAYHFQQSALLSAPAIPILYSAAMLIEGLMALAFGKLFDRFGMPALIFGVLLSSASSPLAFFGSAPAAAVGVLLWGAGSGAQGATLRAQIAALAPADRRGSAYGTFDMVYGILWFAGSAAIGLLYSHALIWAVSFAMAAQLCSIPLLWMVGRKRR